jgi:hypothetical protein
MARGAEEADSDLPPVINAAVLGSVGVGKTTLLASMYGRFLEVIGSINLDIAPGWETSRDFQGLINKLQRLPTSVKVKEALDGTADISHYTFNVGLTGRDPAFALQFTDYSGRYLGPDFFPDRDEVRQTLIDSDVILVAVDAAALMERGGAYHKAVNSDIQVTDEIKSLLRTSDRPRLIILTLVKSETYLETPQSTAAFIAKVKHAYRPLLTDIAKEGIRDRVGCVLAAVKTIGPIRVYDVDVTKPDELVFKFYATRPQAVYAPEDTDQPLRYLLTWVINRYRSERGLLDRARDWAYGLDDDFVAAVDEFAAGCKDSGPVVVLQDHKLLHAARPWRGGGFLR